MTENAQVSTNDIYYRYRAKFARRLPANNLTHLEHIRVVRQMVIDSGFNFVPMGVKKPNIPKVSFGPALPSGHESICEYADIYLKDFVKTEILSAKISDLCKDGYTLLELKRIPCHFPSVEALVNLVEYEIETDCNVSPQMIENFLNKSEILINKIKPSGESETINAKDMIISMDAVSQNRMTLIVKFGSGQHLKPGLIASEICTNSDSFKILRRQLYWKNLKGEIVLP
ncbi:MAG TPA: TIGR03936 family radical SAM-associated protein [Elusimicrobiales bacterium]|nr:TIGR03936 family radical SAM-associated protein [Elusimicrobiales bacterium]